MPNQASNDDEKSDTAIDQLALVYASARLYCLTYEAHPEVAQASADGSCIDALWGLDEAVENATVAISQVMEADRFSKAQTQQ
jgi:3-deoxy-D-manno-octulosonic acid (KDO) 8-phosphate synthase